MPLFFLPVIIFVTAVTLWLQFSSVSQSCPTLCDPMDCSIPGLPIHHQLLEFTQIHVHRLVMPSNHLILCRLLLLLPSIPPSIRVFSNESTWIVIRKVIVIYQNQSFDMVSSLSERNVLCFSNGLN